MIPTQNPRHGVMTWMGEKFTLEVTSMEEVLGDVGPGMKHEASIRYSYCDRRGWVEIAELDNGTRMQSVCTWKVKKES